MNEKQDEDECVVVQSFAFVLIEQKRGREPLDDTDLEALHVGRITDSGSNTEPLLQQFLDNVTGNVACRTRDDHDSLSGVWQRERGCVCETCVKSSCQG